MKEKETISLNECIMMGLKALCDNMDSCFAYIGNYQTGGMIHISKSVEAILGFSQEYFLKGGVDAIRSIVHPEDMPAIVQTIVAVTKEFIDCSKGNVDKRPKVINYHFRGKHHDGYWIPIEQKVITITFTDSGFPDIIFSILSTDNSINEEKMFINKYFDKADKKLLIPFISSASLNKNDKNCSDYSKKDNLGGLVEITTHLNPIRDISSREKEVLKFISYGYSTKEIAEKLNISFHTVESHRKNLLQKFNSKNSAELVKEASKFYWIE